MKDFVSRTRRTACEEQYLKLTTWRCAHSHIWCPPTLTKGCPLFVLLTLHCASGSVSSEDLEPVGLGRSWALLSNRINLVLSVRNYQLCEHTLSLKNMICKSDLCEVLYKWDTEPELAIFYNQTMFLAVGLGHQPSHKTFDTFCNMCWGNGGQFGPTWGPCQEKEPTPDTG